MANYLVRVAPEYSFAEENMSGLGDIFNKLADHLGSDICSILISRFTFGVYSVDADSKEECEEMIRTAWKYLHPGCKEIFLNIFPYPDTADKAELIKSIYFAYYGVEDYIKMITEITPAIEIMRDKDALQAFRMQNYLFAMDKGTGFSTLLASFGDYLHRMGVFEDNEARTQFIEFIIGKETEGETVSQNDAITFFDEKSKENTYNVIGLDIGYFLEGSKEDDLRKFIHRLYKFQNDYIFVFRIPYLEKKSLENISDILSDLVLLRTIQVPPLNKCVLAEHFWNTLSDYGYTSSTDLIDAFFLRVQLEKKDGRFYGFKTAEKIANDMVVKKTVKLSKTKGDIDSETYNTIQASDVTILEKRNEKTGYDALSELVGMDNIIKKVREIVSQVKYTINNDKVERPCIHMRFHGAPGTGKTTVARIIGQIFKEEGILRKGSFLEYSARSLCAEYVGQTAVKTASICRDAYGCVLFLDEAYALYNDGASANDFGKEALTTLISEMENHRDDMLVIMAGYTDDMKELMKGNAGLESRMPYILTFENYSRTQLYEIFMLMVKKHFDYTQELDAEAKKYFTGLSDEYINAKEFANARFVRNLYERTWSKAALRSSLEGLSTLTITKDDFISASSEKEFSQKLTKKTIIGF